MCQGRPACSSASSAKCHSTEAADKAVVDRLTDRSWNELHSQTSKVSSGLAWWSTLANWPNFGGLSALHIRKACEASLQRLQTDYIDLYQFHHIDRNTPWDEIWGAIEKLVQDGKIIYAGSCNFAGWHLARAQEAAMRRNFLGLVSEQSLYNLMERTVELEVLPACQEYGLGVLPWSPLAGGLLAGPLEKSQREGRRFENDTLLGHTRREKRISGNISRFKEYESLCAELGEKPTDVALAWLLAQPAVTASVIGPRNSEQFEGSMRALEIAMTPDLLEKLDILFPGPGAPAPEAYAW
jgi:aryl-alcohol dehydrogenase-like predicted oxidoreductase